jgi:catechol 2,3-dioxygenase-like lactoylglutathione lyase family enzyme
MGIVGYEHVGIRVTDRDEALAFYGKLGFRERLYLPEHEANEMVNAAGVFINLIFNGMKRPARRNILMDEPLKYPGVTHPAFVVDDLDATIALCEREGIRISEGPVEIGERRRVIFVRDPDGNVLEFDELYDRTRKNDENDVKSS